MADFVAWIGDILTIEIAHIGEVAPAGVDVTPGLMIAVAMIFAFGLRVARRLRGLG